eukprot:PhM_4_TR528/c0_g5_i1/m.106183
MNWIGLEWQETRLLMTTVPHYALRPLQRASISHNVDLSWDAVDVQDAVDSALREILGVHATTQALDQVCVSVPMLSSERLIQCTRTSLLAMGYDGVTQLRFIYDAAAAYIDARQTESSTTANATTTSNSSSPVVVMHHSPWWRKCVEVLVVSLHGVPIYTNAFTADDAATVLAAVAAAVRTQQDAPEVWVCGRVPSYVVELLTSLVPPRRMRQVTPCCGSGAAAVVRERPTWETLCCDRTHCVWQEALSSNGETKTDEKRRKNEGKDVEQMSGDDSAGDVRSRLDFLLKAWREPPPSKCSTSTMTTGTEEAPCSSKDETSINEAIAEADHHSSIEENGEEEEEDVRPRRIDLDDDVQDEEADGNAELEVEGSSSAEEGSLTSPVLTNAMTLTMHSLEVHAPRHLADTATSPHVSARPTPQHTVRRELTTMPSTTMHSTIDTQPPKETDGKAQKVLQRVPVLTSVRAMSTWTQAPARSSVSETSAGHGAILSPANEKVVSSGGRHEDVDVDEVTRLRRHWMTRWMGSTIRRISARFQQQYALFREELEASEAVQREQRTHINHLLTMIADIGSISAPHSTQRPVPHATAPLPLRNTTDVDAAAVTLGHNDYVRVNKAAVPPPSERQDIVLDQTATPCSSTSLRPAPTPSTLQRRRTSVTTPLPDSTDVLSLPVSFPHLEEPNDSLRSRPHYTSVSRALVDTPKGFQTPQSTDLSSSRPRRVAPAPPTDPRERREAALNLRFVV